MLGKLIPNQKVNSIYHIDLHQLKQAGYKGIITDLDNTLVGAKDPDATPELIDWLKKAQEMGFLLVIVSNNNRLRVARFSEPLLVPFVHAAKKPTKHPFHRALRILKLDAEEVVMVGDQILTDVFGGNRLGLHTILVDPISLKDESFFTKINRRIEKFALSRLKRKGH